MNPSRRTIGRIAPFALLVTCWLLPAWSAAQRKPNATTNRTTTSAKTPWGDPDLQGTWPGGNVFAVAFERAPELGTRTTLSHEETAKRNTDIDAQLASPPLGNFWPELGHAPALTSLIVEPENGRLPPMTEDGARRARDWRVKAADGYQPGLPVYQAAGPGDLRPFDRCITRGVLGSAFPNQYGTGMQIHQAPGVVVIRYEMVHEARVIPLDARPHLSPAMQSYMGDFARPVGRRHAGGGNHPLQRTHRIVRAKRRRQSHEHGASSGRAVPPARCRDAAVRSARRRSADLGAALEGCCFR